MTVSLRITILLAITAVAVIVFAAEDRSGWDIKGIDTARDADYLSDIEKDVILELNMARSNPKRYAEMYIDPNLGAYAKECYGELRAAKSLPALLPKRGLSQAAKDHAADIGPKGITGHDGADGSTMAIRVNRYGAWKSSASENLSFGAHTARGIVTQLLIDDGVESRGHRKNIMDGASKFVGVAFGAHSKYKYMCVQDFAGEYTDKDIPKSAAAVSAVAEAAPQKKKPAGASFKDPRDGQSYGKVKVGRQTWMSENLNYDAKGSRCYKNDDANCAEYGRLYDWDAAYAACPAGWRLPSADDWDTLENTVGESTAGTKLKSPDGWESARGAPAGTDDFGFSALPGGVGYPNGLAFGDAGKQGYWWTATEYRSDGSYDASTRNLTNHGEELLQFWRDKTHKFSVRCVEGEDPKRKAAPPAKAKPVVSTFKDSRDGKTYKKVSVGEQVWMAENLNYAADDSKCYGNNNGNCAKYGRLYDWYAASEACPAGWHLPSDGELMKMKEYVNSGGGDKVGRKLKSSTGWHATDDPHAGGGRDVSPGTDEYGFSAFPGGYYDKYKDRYSDGPAKAGKCCYRGRWWNATEYGDSLAFYWEMTYQDEGLGSAAGSSLANKEDGFHSVRCVENGKGYVAAPPRQRPPAPAKPAPVAGTFKDSRDGKTYKTVAVGRNTWMAENLNYDAKGSACYKNSADSCARYGRLYDWKTATQACPAGWRLPADEEWSALETVDSWKTAGTRLKSSNGWERSGKTPVGSDSYGFTALSGGNSGFGSDIEFRKSGEIGYWWSATEVDATSAWRRTIDKSVEKVYRAYYDKRDKYSVRCVREQ